MPQTSHAPRATHQTQPFRAESETNSQDKPPNGGWREAAKRATTLGELYEAARQGQAAGDWTEHDQVRCELLRELLGIHAEAIAMVKRDLGGTPLEVS